MSEQTIQSQATKLKSVQIKPECDILVVQEGRSASISYSVGRLIPGTPSIPEIPGKVGRGAIVDGAGKIIEAAIDGYPVTPAVPAKPDSMEVVDSGTVEMTGLEWDSWDSKTNDFDYRTSIVAKRLGWTLDGKFTPVA